MIGIAPFSYAAKAAEHRAAHPLTVSRRRRRRSALVGGALGRRRRIAAPALGN